MNHRSSNVLLLILKSSTLLLHLKAQECYDSPGFLSNFESDDCYCGGGCDWFAEPLGDDDYEYYDDIYGDFETRCEAFGSCCKQDGGGMTAAEACCACGGGFSNPVPSLNPSNTPQPTEAKCYDVPGWFSADSNTSRNHYDCEWFCSPVYDDDDGTYEEGDTRCGLYGDESENFGYTANEACCCCGGGYYGENVPSISPTVSNAPSLSDPPTLEPSIPPPPCMDIPGWKDRTGTRCSWYAQSVRMDDYYDDDDNRCALYGNKYRKNGHTANTACCVCGGGIEIEAPSITPSKKLTTSPSMVLSSAPSMAQSSSNSGSSTSSSSVTALPNTSNPSKMPSEFPTGIPTMKNSSKPTDDPTLVISSEPSMQSSDLPSFVPSSIPSMKATLKPSVDPTVVLSIVPSTVSSESPSFIPSSSPSITPSITPSRTPSTTPSLQPVEALSTYDSSTPSITPSITPSLTPSTTPSLTPSITPSETPSTTPSTTPSITPSETPSNTPSKVSSSYPSKMDLYSDESFESVLVEIDAQAVLPNGSPIDISTSTSSPVNTLLEGDAQIFFPSNSPVASSDDVTNSTPPPILISTPPPMDENRKLDQVSGNKSLSRNFVTIEE